MTGHVMTRPDSGDPTAARSAAELDPRLLVDQAGIKGYGIAFVRRVRSGELGSLPVIVGLVVIWLIFWSREHSFLSAGNLSNLAVQMVPIGMISVGIVMVLLLGEVDLSVGSISGVCAALLGTQIAQHNRSAGVAIVLAILLGAGLGLIHGLFFSRLGVPSFVVTLAGLLAWQGLQLRILGKTGTVQVTTGFVHELTYNFLSKTAGWILFAILLLVSLLGQVWERIQRSRAGLRPRPWLEIGFRLVLLGVVTGVAVAVFNSYTSSPGVPLALVIFIGVIVFFDIVIRRTTYGRHVLAVGGNVEAARRAGISIWLIRTSVFVIAGIMAAIGGIFSTSQLLSVSQQTGGTNTVLYAIAAAVIGGTSLFGGRGSAYSALLGILVITSITNGMALLSLPSATQFMVTGGVTLAAVTLDSLSRRGQRASGRG